MKLLKFKNIKFLPFLITCILIVLPIGSLKAFAYPGGLLDGKTINRGTDQNTTSSTSTAITANDGITSYTSLGVSGGSADTFWYSFGSPVSINKYYVTSNGSSNTQFSLQFYNSSGSLITSMSIPASVSGPTTIPIVTNVSKVALVNLGSQINVYEWDLFGVDTIPPANVTNLTPSGITENGFNASWTAPTDSDLNQFKIYLNGTLVDTISKAVTSYSFSQLNPDTSYSLKVTSVDGLGNESSGSTLTVKTNIKPDVTAPSNVTNLTGTPTYNSVSLSWTNPPETDFAKVKVYENGVYQKSVTAAEDSTAYFGNLDPQTQYTFKVTSVDNTGNESNGSSIQVTTLPLPELKNIKNLNVDAKYNKVKLTWDLPDSEYFHHVTIYRKELEKVSFLQNMFGSTKAYASDTTDGFTPMFETNGTYWTDLTVIPDTSYEYKLTTVNTDGRESQGIITDTTTPQEPKPILDGATFSTSSSGDYIVSWTNPTSGTVRIIVGETVLQEVNAETKTFTISKSDMKYTYLGDPDVKLQPVGKFGTEGDKVVAPGTINQTKIPFTVNDLILSGNGLLWLVGPFVLLALAFLLVPKLRNLVFSAFGKNEKDSKEIDDEERRIKSIEDANQGRHTSKKRKIVEKKEKSFREPKETRIRSKREPRISSR
jgi:hypothetical protein